MTPASPPSSALLPHAEEVCRLFHAGHETWAPIVHKAKGQPPGKWPTHLLDPYIALHNIPALPRGIPLERRLTGRVSWRIPPPDTPPSKESPRCSARRGKGHVTKAGEDWDPTLVVGEPVHTYLSNSRPVHCSLSDDATSNLLESNDPKIKGSIAVLTLCWGYILSARLTEHQECRMEYTEHRIHPLPHDAEIPPNVATITLPGASPELVRWLCALLSPRPGWARKGEGVPPWQLLLSDAGTVCIRTDDSHHLVGKPDAAGAPDSQTAVTLLAELCRLCGLGGSGPDKAGMGAVTPFEASFLAALVIPLYHSMSLEPCFPMPNTGRFLDRAWSHKDEQRLGWFDDDLPYFMTLSLQSRTIGSTLWGVFWAPDIDCNLTNPWLTSIHNILRPMIETNDVESIVKTLLLRRSGCGMWWYAMFALGDRSLLAWIPRYLDEVEEKFGYASLYQPQLMSAVWTGVATSFLHSGTSRSYNGAGKVSRADLIRCRVNYKLQADACRLPAWRPLGFVDRADVEPEMLPWLDDGCEREYLGFFWYMPGGRQEMGLGYCLDTGREPPAVPDDMTMQLSDKGCLGDCAATRLDHKQSQKSTWVLMDFLVENARGERFWGYASLPGTLKDHPWLERWEGLVSPDRALPVKVPPPPQVVLLRRQIILAWLQQLEAEE